MFPPGTFEGYRRDGELARGPGVLDMKGGLVVVAWALKALAQAGALTTLPGLRLVIVADEEVGSPEGQSVIKDAIAGASGALVFEAGRKNDLVITRRKGTGAVTVTAHGKAAHAGNAHKEGANALWALAKLVDRAQGLTDYARGVTVNVGKVTGGTSKNTVPDRAEALIDLRFETRADGEALVEALRKAAEECAASVQGTRIEIEGGIARLPLERTEASARLMESYGAAAQGRGARQRRGAAHRRRLRRQHRACDGHRGHRRARPARHRLPHEGRADRGRARWSRRRRRSRASSPRCRRDGAFPSSRPRRGPRGTWDAALLLARGARRIRSRRVSAADRR